jgi:hypothetical protein
MNVSKNNVHLRRSTGGSFYIEDILRNEFSNQKQKERVSYVIESDKNSSELTDKKIGDENDCFNNSSHVTRNENCNCSLVSLDRDDERVSSSRSTDSTSLCCRHDERSLRVDSQSISDFIDCDKRNKEWGVVNSGKDTELFSVLQPTVQPLKRWSGFVNNFHQQTAQPSTDRNVCTDPTSCDPIRKTAGVKLPTWLFCTRYSDRPSAGQF